LTENLEQSGAEPGGGVGAVLRARRMALGQHIADVAEHLRIRQAYLVAMESGRFHELPGSTYASGFMRAYADYLELDSEEILRRFKEEAAGGLDNRTELVFPSPVSEGRIPGGAILFLGLVLAAAAYGGWYYMSSREESIAELVPALPERLRVLITGEEPPRPVVADSGETAPVVEEPAERPAAPVAEAPAAAPSDAAPEAALAEAEPPAAAPAPERSLPEQAAAGQSLAEQPSPGQPAAEQPAAEQPTADAVAAAPPPPAVPEETPEPDLPVVTLDAAPATEPVPEASVAATTPPPPPPAPPEAEGANGDGPRVYGQNNADSRIVLRAVDDSWIQVRENDTLLLTRLMRPGDTYRVPNRPGLTLMTGSAGGLEVVVDGQAAPSLGPVGAVRRGIALEPQKLLAGNP